LARSLGNSGKNHFPPQSDSHYGFAQEEKKKQDQQAQAEQALEGEPPQEAFALQVVAR
jgi:hypothetical protein